MLMGILNVTPDSFSDGGVHFSRVAAVETGLRMVREGADVIDVGGESTRPGAEAITAEKELGRIQGVVQELIAKSSRISVDTSKASVASRCLEMGAWMINDVSALGDPDMATVCARAGCQVCLMHMQGNPRTMQSEPTYNDVVSEVRTFLLERAAYAESNGIAKKNIWIDPGIGFGKNLNHNLILLQNLDVLVATGYKVLIGISRKSFLGKILDPAGVPVTERLEATLAAQVMAQSKGAACIRAHDVKEARRSIDTAAAILAAKP